MNKIAKIIIIVIALALVLGGVYFIYSVLHGDVFTKAKLYKDASSYVSKTYGDNYLVSKAVYNFKDGGYSCNVMSNISTDTHFSVYKDSDGKIRDNYKNMVKGKRNTLNRLTAEFDSAAEDIYTSVFPNKVPLVACTFYEASLGDYKAEVVENDKIQIDMESDIKNPPLPLEITLWVICKEPSFKTLAKALNDAKETAEKFGFAISYYSVSLRKEAPDNDEKDENMGLVTDFYASDIPSSVINESDEFVSYLIKRVNEDATNAK